MLSHSPDPQHHTATQRGRMGPCYIPVSGVQRPALKCVFYTCSTQRVDAKLIPEEAKWLEAEDNGGYTGIVLHSLFMAGKIT